VVKQCLPPTVVHLGIDGGKVGVILNVILANIEDDKAALP
jgi:hypothetical protein